ncbi:hypothetical protein Tco_0578165 [Tanacetum coccineum]
MNTTQAQQKALDDALVAPVDHLEFEKCNIRLKTDIKPKEATFQVMLDTLALTLYQGIPDQYRSTSLSEFELTKILIDKMEKNKGVEMKTKIETLLLDQTKRRKEGNQVKILSLPEIQEEPSHTVEDSGMQQDQEFVTGDNDEQPDNKETWISQVAHAKEPPASFDEFNDTSFDFSKFFLNRLKIPNLTQEILGLETGRYAVSSNVGYGVLGFLRTLFDVISSFGNIIKSGHAEEAKLILMKDSVDFRPPQTWISQVARVEEPPTSFDKLSDTSFDFSAFVMNRLKIPHLTQEILVGPTFNLLKDLEYLNGGDLSRRYSTSMTKIKAATYDLKWIEDLVPNLWSPVQVKYDQHAYLGTSHWGPKRQIFYGYASNMTSSKDVYSRRIIIAVTRLKIMKMYDYGHLEEIEVRRDDQKLYTFKEGDFKRLRLQDIEDMLLLLVQQKLTNLIIKE